MAVELPCISKTNVLVQNWIPVNVQLIMCSNKQEPGIFRMSAYGCKAPHGTYAGILGARCIDTHVILAWLLDNLASAAASVSSYRLWAQVYLSMFNRAQYIQHMMLPR